MALISVVSKPQHEKPLELIRQDSVPVKFLILMYQIDKFSVPKDITNWTYAVSGDQ